MRIDGPPDTKPKSLATSASWRYISQENGVSQQTTSTMISSNSKVCLITGATSGIGKVAAFSLAEQGFKLLLVARSREKGEAIQQAIKESMPDSTTELYVGDLSSRHSICTLATN